MRLLEHVLTLLLFGHTLAIVARSTAQSESPRGFAPTVDVPTICSYLRGSEAVADEDTCEMLESTAPTHGCRERAAVFSLATGNVFVVLGDDEGFRYAELLGVRDERAEQLEASPQIDQNGPSGSCIIVVTLRDNSTEIDGSSFYESSETLVSIYGVSTQGFWGRRNLPIGRRSYSGVIGGHASEEGEDDCSESTGGDAQGEREDDCRTSTGGALEEREDDGFSLLIVDGMVEISDRRGCWLDPVYASAHGLGVDRMAIEELPEFFSWSP